MQEEELIEIKFFPVKDGDVEEDDSDILPCDYYHSHYTNDDFSGVLHHFSIWLIFKSVCPYTEVTENIIKVPKKNLDDVIKSALCEYEFDCGNGEFITLLPNIFE